MRWKVADGTRPYHDHIRMPNLPDEGIETNSFFVDLYRTVGEDLLVCLEEEDLMAYALRLQPIEDFEQSGEVVAASGIRDDRRLGHGTARQPEQIAQRLDHLGREVVHAEIAGILEGRDRLRLPGTGMTGDNDELHLFACLNLRFVPFGTTGALGHRLFRFG